MKNIPQLFLIVLLSVLYLPAQSTLENVKELHLDKHQGNFQTYYSNGFEEQAISVSDLLNQSIHYFEQKLDVKEPFTLAILDLDDWNKITRIPYGLPFISGPPHIVCIPANIKNELGTIVLKAISDSKLDQKYSLSNEEIAYRFTNLIGFHELGHMYAKKLGINFPNKWTFEFAATYLAFLYLQENSPKDNELWLDVASKLLKEIQPTYTSLKDFDEKYVQVGIENYAWYQVVFLERVGEVVKKSGWDFITGLNNENLGDENYSMNKFENLCPGFLKWAKDYKLLH